MQVHLEILLTDLGEHSFQIVAGQGNAAEKAEIFAHYLAINTNDPDKKYSLE